MKGKGKVVVMEIRHFYSTFIHSFSFPSLLLYLSTLLFLLLLLLFLLFPLLSNQSILERRSHVFFSFSLSNRKNEAAHTHLHIPHYYRYMRHEAFTPAPNSLSLNVSTHHSMTDDLHNSSNNNNNYNGIFRRPSLPPH